jgi:hypothetical protein
VAIATPLIARSAERGTEPILFAATSPAAEPLTFLGPSIHKWDSKVHFAPVVPPGDDLAAASRLWSVSADLTGVRYLADDTSRLIP